MTSEESVLLMRHPRHVSVFRRTGDGDDVMVFEPGVPVIVSESQFEFLREDVGRGLVIVDLDDKDRPRVDWDTTTAVLNDQFADEPIDGVTGDVVDEPNDSAVSDVEFLVAAGIDANLAEKLAANVAHPLGGDWVLDPDAIRAKVAEGFDLADLDEIGKVSAKKILAALEI